MLTVFADGASTPPDMTPAITTTAIRTTNASREPRTAAIPSPLYHLLDVFICSQSPFTQH